MRMPTNMDKEKKPGSQETVTQVGNVKVIRRLLRVDDVIGENTAPVTVTSSVEFPRDVRKIVPGQIDAVVTQVTTRVMQDKVIVDGTIHKQIYYIGTDDAEYELSVDEHFTGAVSVPGARPGMDATVRVKVLNVTHQLDRTNPRLAQQTVVLSVFAKVTQAVQMNVVTDIVGPNVTVKKELLKVDAVVGEANVTPQVKFTLQFPRPVKKIKEVHSEIRQVTGSVSEEDMVLLEGVLHKQIYYVVAETAPESERNRVFEMSVDENFSTVVEIPGAREGMDVFVFPKDNVDVQITLSPENNNTAQQIADLPFFVKVTQVMQLNVVVGATGVQVQTELLKVQDVVGENTAPATVDNIIDLPRDARKIANWDGYVHDVTATAKTDRVQVSGMLHKQLYYVSTDDAVYEQSVEEPFTANIDVPGARPEMNAYARVTLDDSVFTLNLAAGQTATRQVKQTATLGIFAKVTETKQMNVVTGVAGMAPTPPGPCPPGTLRTYIVQPGDTLYLIAQRYGVHVSDIIAANPSLTNPDVLYVGQVLMIPCPPAKG